jgi:hydroxyacylglutathione hydrolase
MPEILTLTGGPFDANSYLLLFREAGQAVVVDPGFMATRLADEARARGLAIVSVLVTHGHVDHVLGVGRFPGATVFFPEGDRFLVGGAWEGEPVRLPTVCRDLRHQDVVPLPDGTSLTVLATPGHSPGSVSLYWSAAGVVFTGDALFAGSIGRTDLPGGDFGTLVASIQAQLLTLPDATRVLAGHGPETTVGRERELNPFLL